jgi:tetratricopeptide (TPR) repeat protein
MIRFGAIATLLLLLCAHICYAQTERKAEEYLKRGDALLDQRDLEGAIRTYTRAIELAPGLGEAYVKRGIALRTNGNLNDAIDDFEVAEKIDVHATAGNRYIAESYSNRGYIEIGQLQIERAITDFNKAIELHADPIHYFRRGEAYLIDEDVEVAVKDFDRALNLNPATEFLCSMICADRAYALLLQGNEKQAQSDLDSCPGIDNNRRVFELHLRTIEQRMKQRRRLRVQDQKNIAQNKPIRGWLNF